MRRRHLSSAAFPALLLAALTLLAGCAGAQARPASPGPGDGGDRAARPTGPKPYAEVIRGTTPDSGVFTVHQSDEKLLFEIPDSLLGREMLVITRIARVPGEIAGFVVSGHKVHEQVWTWEREGKRVLLRKQSYQQVAADTTPIATSVVNNNFPPVVAAFGVEAEAPGGGVVVDVTKFYAEDTPAISPLSAAQRRDWQVRRLDPARSFIVFARSFPENVDVRNTVTYEAGSPPGRNNTGTISLEMHHTMVVLPAVPMRPRLADARVGYFSVSRVNFGLPEQKAAEETFIRRWRLEPKDPAAYHRGELVEPVKPIAYYLDPATPTEWRPCVRQGVLDWNTAFETAGFRNAVLALDAPSPAEDPDWDQGDVRYSVVRWAASLVRNAMGPSVSDPRSGEIIESDIVWYHNHMRSYRNRLMLETGASNPGARDLPIEREQMCEAMRQVIAHEVGHALGLPHNMIASSSYPVERLRDPAFAASMGVSASVMDYARQNYIAQPGDGLSGDDFIRQIGPYDHHSINWGYRVIPDAPTPEAEKTVLNRWIVEKAHDPMYRFGGGPYDPRAQTEDLGDDPVAASTYGVANLRRVTPNLISWTTDPGRDYGDLEELYGELLGQWSRYMGHVVTMVGGIYEDAKTAEQPGGQYDGVSRTDQKRALDFLAAHVFDAPTWLNDTAILERVGGNAFDRLAGLQARVLGGLLDARRLARLAELEVTDPADAYPLAEYLGDLRRAVWGTSLPATAIDPYRRALQRTYVEELKSLMTEEPGSNPFQGQAPNIGRSDIRPLARAQLRSIQADARTAAGRTGEAVARAHLLDIVDRIAAILEPNG
ncbi:MAG TPA: zinc-dependent metalloprotease [Gemmatimonadota bacterium]|nr:zinc-dependent metalloprotease [Gemmatimonadota bacterium]